MKFETIIKVIVNVAIPGLLLFSYSDAFASDYSDEFTGASLEPKWSWVDPLGDCSYSLVDRPGYLRIYVPNGGHDLWIYSNLNAPRAMQTVTDDFVVETRLSFDPLYNAQGAGIVIWKDSDNYMRLWRGLYWQHGVVVQVELNDVDFHFADVLYSNPVTYLRVERTGNVYVCSYSGDGENWDVLSTIGAPFLGPINIGLYVHNEWQDNPVYADFDYFRVNVNETLPSFRCSCFEPPMDNGPVTVKNNNRALPLKAELFNSDGVPVTNLDIVSPPVIQVVFLPQVGEAVDVTKEAIAVGQGTEGNQFVFTAEGKWQFNLKLTNYSAPGSYQVLMYTGDSLEYTIAPMCSSSFVIK